VGRYPHSNSIAEAWGAYIAASEVCLQSGEFLMQPLHLCVTSTKCALQIGDFAVLGHDHALCHLPGQACRGVLLDHTGPSRAHKKGGAWWR
jgi:hypothetical protein